jgi:hypothetical protein
MQPICPAPLTLGMERNPPVQAQTSAKYIFLVVIRYPFLLAKS